MVIEAVGELCGELVEDDQEIIHQHRRTSGGGDGRPDTSWMSRPGNPFTSVSPRSEVLVRRSDREKITRIFEVLTRRNMPTPVAVRSRRKTPASGSRTRLREQPPEGSSGEIFPLFVSMESSAYRVTRAKPPSKREGKTHRLRVRTKKKHEKCSTSSRRNYDHFRNNPCPYR